jgi:hypothetical protein
MYVKRGCLTCVPLWMVSYGVLQAVLTCAMSLQPWSSQGRTMPFRSPARTAESGADAFFWRCRGCEDDSQCSAAPEPVRPFCCETWPRLAKNYCDLSAVPPYVPERVQTRMPPQAWEFANRT